MASELKVNTLTGVSTAGSIAVTGEGNSTTTNLQQGLAKAWVNLNGTSTAAVRDSFNNSSITDHGTGNYSNTVSSAFDNANYVVTAMSQDTSVGDVIAYDSGTAPTTTAVKMYNFTTGSSVADCARICISYQGDLA